MVKEVKALTRTQQLTIAAGKNTAPLAPTAEPANVIHDPTSDLKMVKDSSIS